MVGCHSTLLLLLLLLLLPRYRWPCATVLLKTIRQAMLLLVCMPRDPATSASGGSSIWTVMHKCTHAMIEAVQGQFEDPYCNAKKVQCIEF
jgi:hypothetical protein